MAHLDGEVGDERGALSRRRAGRRRRVERTQRLAQLVEEREASEDGSIPDNPAALGSSRRQ